MDGEAGWWTTIGNIGLPPLARVMGVGRQQHDMVKTYSSMGLVMALYVAMIVSFCFPHVVDVSALSISCCCDFYVFVVCEFGVDSQS